MHPNVKAFLKVAWVAIVAFFFVWYFIQCRSRDLMECTFVASMAALFGGGGAAVFIFIILMIFTCVNDVLRDVERF
jgi:hypothetical protein